TYLIKKWRDPVCATAAATTKSTAIVKIPVFAKPDIAFAGDTIWAATSTVVENIITRQGSQKFFINIQKAMSVTMSEYQLLHVKSVQTKIPQKRKRRNITAKKKKRKMLSRWRAIFFVLCKIHALHV